MMMQFERFGIDISKDPVLIYPTCTIRTAE